MELNCYGIYCCIVHKRRQPGTADSEPQHRADVQGESEAGVGHCSGNGVSALPRRLP